MEIKFKKLDPRAVAPSRAYTSDAGVDLTATSITTEINECGQLILVYHTGLALEIPEGYCGILVPRSSIFKKSIALTNCAGVVDSGYRGEVMAKFRTTTDVVPAVYREGERFAQLLIMPVPEVTFTEAFELSDSDRSDKGYGSSDSANNATESAPTGSVNPSGTEENVDEQTVNEGSGEVQGDLEQAE